MNEQTDSQLLRAYAEDRSETAFAELMRRHLDLVYSAARRMVCDSHLAQDVTQGVFLALAKSASGLTARPVLSGWLHRTAQNIAAQTVRTSVRRQAREQEAATMNLLLSTETGSSWQHLAPELDAALGALSEPDRDALLLRYFERKSAREMALTLGISDDAAQKRVNRAVDRLRECLAERGVTLGASGLVVLLSANAIEAAPAGLAAAISTAVALAGNTLTHAATFTAVKTIAMTTFQKTLFTATLAIVAGMGIYQAHQASTLKSQNRTLREQQLASAELIKQLQSERTRTADLLAGLQAGLEKPTGDNTELLRLRGEVTRLRNASSKSSGDSQEALVEFWRAREEKFKQVISQHADRLIPEFDLLSRQDWINAAMDAKYDTEQDVRRTVADFRKSAERIFATKTTLALMKYYQANNGQFPTDLAQLQPYFETPMEDRILARWEILPGTALPSLCPGWKWVITQKIPLNPDVEFDTTWAIGPNFVNSKDYASVETERAQAAIAPALKAFAADHNGNPPADLSEVRPYVTRPEQSLAFFTLMKKQAANSAPK